MLSTILKGAALGVTAILLADQASSLALWGVVITSAAGLIAQYLKNRDDAAREERRHRYDLEERQLARQARAELQRGLAENTALTREASGKADAAFEVGNHLNEKIADIARTALAVDRATARQDTADIRRDIAEFRESGK